MSKYFYAVRVGNAPGIYNTWSECEREVRGFKGAKFKKFKTYEEALSFVEDKGASSILDKIDFKEAKDKVIDSKPIKDKIDIGVEEKQKEIAAIVEIEDISQGDAISYVDGSFSLSTMTFSYGVVMISKDGIETFKGMDRDPELAKMRNVSGELKGAMVAMDIALDRGYKTLSLHYDYAGIEKWALGQWKTNKDGTKSYKQYYDSIKDKLDVRFVKVKAHTGVEYNELADQLAKEAIEESIISFLPDSL
nr:viroplasmin family protein [Tissierella sp.]